MDSFDRFRLLAVQPTFNLPPGNVNIRAVKYVPLEEMFAKVKESIGLKEKD